MPLHLPIALTLLIGTSAFVLDEIKMDDATFQACSTCDSRADRVVSINVAAALRQYLSQKHVRLAIERGDVVVQGTMPNTNIPTGHSCKYRAEARDIRVDTEMVNDKDYLDANLGTMIPFESTEWIVGKVPHQVIVDMDMRVRFGMKVFGSCKQYMRKTCGTRAVSTGVNQMYFTLVASDAVGYSRDGQDFLEFTLKVDMKYFTNTSTYSPFHVTGGCNLPFNIANLEEKMKRFSQTLVDSHDFVPMRSERLMRKLEEILKAPIESGRVTVPVSVEGSRRTRREVGRCTRMKCPEGFTRVGNTRACNKYFGPTRPDCSQHFPGSELRTGEVMGYTIYYCEATMVPA